MDSVDSEESLLADLDADPLFITLHGPRVESIELVEADSNIKGRRHLRRKPL